MIVTGFIKEIGAPREWKTRENKSRYSYPVVIAVPYIDKNGTERSDEILGEMNAANPEWVQKVEDLLKNESRVNVTLGLSVSEWEDKKYQRVKVVDIQILL